ncbi:hypothetical protein OHA10_06505 [Kribbella sp. NBC_00662]|uniref:hypothetical protein n=1 Tax=Kribbella sp. NBC_00662 TaxID=2975969 RepID=UPI003246D53F
MSTPSSTPAVSARHGSVMNPHVVTICGSTRFREAIAAANRKLTLAGQVVLAPGVFAHNDAPDADPISDADKQRLDRLHLAKIDISCWVLVVNPGGYIGDSTRREIAYAGAVGVPVQYLEQVAS